MKKTSSIFLFLLLFLNGCMKDEIETFNLDECLVYFQEHTYSGANGSEGYSTTTSYSFVGREQSFTQYVFKARVRLMGQITDYDRPVKVVVDQENTTMIEGEGFEINTDSIVIKAGENSALIGVRILRAKALRERVDTLTLKLEPNDHFDVLDKYKSSNDWRNTTANAIDGSRYRFIMTEIYTRPSSWSGSSPLYVTTYFGAWNPTKFIFINEFFGFSLNDWVFVNSATSKLSAGRMHFYAKQLQQELQKRAGEGNPVLDEDGSYMQLPQPYSVEY